MPLRAKLLEMDFAVGDLFFRRSPAAVARLIIALAVGIAVY
jgi:hypothetical protein